MNQPSLNPPRRHRRWLRLSMLIACIGMLSIVGAVLGRGLGAFSTGNAQAYASTAAPARVPAPAPTILATIPAPTRSSSLIAGQQQEREGPTTTAASAPTQPAQLATQPPAATRGSAPILSVAPFPTARPAAGAAAPMRLPKTAGETPMRMLAAIAAALYVVGLAIWVGPRIISTRRDEKE